VSARTALALLFKNKYLDRAITAGIKPAELDTIATEGEKARLADAEQKEQLAAIQIARSDRKQDAVDLMEREGMLRDRLPAVIGELESGRHRPLAQFLSAVSFARFRYRELAPPPPDPNAPPAPTPAAGQPAPEELREIARVPREDIVTRASALAAFCNALLKPGREPIVAELAERGLSADWLKKLADDATVLAAAGRNSFQSVAATTREAEAAAAQKVAWLRIKRMVRKAVAGVAELASKYAEC